MEIVPYYHIQFLLYLPAVFFTFSSYLTSVSKNATKKMATDNSFTNESIPLTLPLNIIDLYYQKKNIDICMSRNSIAHAS